MPKRDMAIKIADIPVNALALLLIIVIILSIDLNSGKPFPIT